MVSVIQYSNETGTTKLNGVCYVTLCYFSHKSSTDKSGMYSYKNNNQIISQIGCPLSNLTAVK